jgi:hypothetical protein
MSYIEKAVKYRSNYFEHHEFYHSAQSLLSRYSQDVFLNPGFAKCGHPRRRPPLKLVLVGASVLLAAFQEICSHEKQRIASS